MATINTLPVTAEEYRRMPDPGQPTELVRGKIVMMSRPGARHGWICNRIGRLLGNFVEQHDLGYVVNNDSGVVTEQDPDTVRGPDVTFYSFNRIPKQPGLPEGYPDVAPELAIEVLSPHDKSNSMLTRIAELLNAGTLIVCVVDPRKRHVTCYYPDREEERLTEEQDLHFAEILPGFVLKVKQVFGS